MTRTFTLPDALALRDLQVYLGRAERIENGSVRLICANGVLAVYVAVFYPAGLLDQAPTILGLRTFAVSAEEDFDAVVPVRSLAERVNRLEAAVESERTPVSISLPMEVNTVTWAAISAPRGGWVALPSADQAALARAARAGIEEVATAVPTGTGEQIVHRVRSEVWGRPIPGLEHIPAGAAFAAESLGFLGGTETVGVFESGPWTRLSTQRGHVLIKRKAWTLSR